MSDILDIAREELAKGNGADSCPLCYSLIRALVADGERLERERDEAQAQLASTRADLHMTLKTAAKQQDEIDATRAEVEAAFRAGYASRGSLFSLPENVDAAWSRYQQERGKG